MMPLATRNRLDPHLQDLHTVAYLLVFVNTLDQNQHPIASLSLYTSLPFFFFFLSACCLPSDIYYKIVLVFILLPQQKSGE